MKTKFQENNQDSRKSAFAENTIRLGLICVARMSRFPNENQIPEKQSGFTKINIRRKYN